MTNDQENRVALHPLPRGASMLDHLSDVATDLWGAPAPTESRGSAAPAESAAFPPFEQLWKVADETVDWTDALAYAHPSDGLTSENLWRFFHEHAERVLAGEPAAYVEVLRATNPLGDLTPYAAGFEVTCESADCLRAAFTARPCYLKGGLSEDRRYLAGVSLRVARDLMALLPVRAVTVEARDGERTLLTVPFERAELQRVRFGFIDPEEFVRRCGGEFK